MDGTLELEDREGRGDWRMMLRPVSVGRDGSRAGLPSGAPAFGGCSAMVRMAEDCPRVVEIARGGVTEWFDNGPEGIEFGYVVPAAPGGIGPLTVEVLAAGDLDGVEDAGGGAVEFFDAARAVLRVGGAFAWDAGGRPLPARLEWDGSLRIVVQDDGAIYPVTIDPVISSPASWQASGPSASAGLGASVSTAGDVNGDGFADLAVGAPGFDNGLGGEGAVFVFHGSAAGLSVTADWEARGDQQDMAFAAAVSAAGDVNGDDFGDLIVGAPGASDTQTAEGAAYVFAGSAGGLGASPLWFYASGQPDSAYGQAVASAGDVNGDGYADVLVGAELYDGASADRGLAHAFYGSSAGPAASPSWAVQGTQTGAMFGYALDAAGDVNGDGYGDVAVGAPGFDLSVQDSGRAYVYHGSSSGLSGSSSWIKDGTLTGEFFGAGIAGAGDTNGDGYADLIAGAPGYSNGQAGEGRAAVFFGSAFGVSATAWWNVESDLAGVAFGTSVAPAGDVNGDGYADFLVGAPFGGTSAEGSARLYLGGKPGPSTTPVWSGTGGQNNAHFGMSVMAAGDVNGDGFADIAVGAPDYDGSFADEGRAFVYHGAGRGLAAAAGTVIESNQSGSEFGLVVANAGDVNGGRLRRHHRGRARFRCR
ncbi:MAG: integrin alpha [Deltaproteobacteria bacterium]|nr:integrin alpha [Deltaproteobacteria bacterium]